MDAGLPESAQRVQAALEVLGLRLSVVQMPETTGTAEEAAATIGCAVGQIAKSILFKGVTSGKPILVVASGVNRVNEKRIEEYTGEPVIKAKTEFVRAATGYVIGGVPPIGFTSVIETWIDKDLLNHSDVWAAAGTRFSVFCLSPQLLPKITGGRVVVIT